MKTRTNVIMTICLAGLAGLAAATIAGQTAPPIHPTEASDDLPGADELVRAKGRFSETWVHPEASFPVDGPIHVWEPVVRFRDVEDRPRASGLTTSNLKKGSEFAVTDDFKDDLRTVVTEALEKELGRSKRLQLVDEPEAGAYILRPMVLDAVSHVPPSYHGTADVYLSSVGEATVVFDLVDAESGRVQARFAERQRIEPPGRARQVSDIPATSASVRNDLVRWASSTAAELRKELEETP